MQLLTKLEYMNVTTRIQNLRAELSNKQNLMKHAPVEQELIIEENELKIELSKWSMIEESIYREKSRVQWLKLGDSNTAYFFASMKERRNQNQIKVLQVENGSIIKGTEEVTTEIVGFYRRLLGTSTTHLAAIHPDVIKDAPVLNRHHQLQLIQPFTATNVNNALIEIDDNKAPGGMVSIHTFSRKPGRLLVGT